MVGPLLGGLMGGLVCCPAKPVSAIIFFGGVALPACDSVGERSVIGLLTWVPNNVDFISSLCVDVVNPVVSKFVVLEIAPVDRAMSGFLVIVHWADVLCSTLFSSFSCVLS
jgi:hypothetical protein